MSLNTSLARSRHRTVASESPLVPRRHHRELPPAPRPHLDLHVGRLDSWKEIAVFLNRTVRTIQRWEKHEGLPIHRHIHSNGPSVYALKSEILAWQQDRSTSVLPPLSQPADFLSQLYFLCLD